jgi:hypothetical protein
LKGSRGVRGKRKEKAAENHQKIKRNIFWK